MNFFPIFGDTQFQIKWFTIIYILTIIPCWISLFFAIKNLLNHQRIKFIYWSIILIVLLALPYAFVLWTMTAIHWVYWALLFIVVLYSYYRLLRKRQNFSVDWFWNWYAKSYDTLLHFTPYTVLIHDIVEEISEMTKQDEQTTVLELGCGTGNIAAALKSIDNLNYTGIDASKDMLSIAEKKMGGKKDFLFVQQDIDKPDFNLKNKFDVIVINNVLYALKDHHKIIAVVSKLIAEKGKLVISEPLRNSSIIQLTKIFLHKGGFRAFLRLAIHIFPFLILLTANVIITQIEHIKKKNFFEEDELSQLIKQQGLIIISSKKVYEKQNVMLVAKLSTT